MICNNIRNALKFPNKKSKTEFFNPSVKYFVEHDLIHEKVAIEDKPAYTKCLTGEVMFSNKLFNLKNTDLLLYLESNDCLLSVVLLKPNELNIISISFSISISSLFVILDI